MLPSRDGETTPSLNNGTLTKCPRPSRTITGSLTHLTSKEMVDQPTSDAQPQTQDGGNFSELTVDILSMRKERLLKLKTRTTLLIEKTTTSKLETREVILDNNGTSSMLMNTLSQRKVN